MKAKLDKVWKVFVTGLCIVFIVVITIHSVGFVYNMEVDFERLEKRVDYLERRYEEFKKPVNSAIDKWEQLKGFGAKDD